MTTYTNDLLMEDGVECPLCHDEVPRGHTILRAELGRVCWFCHTDESTTESEDDWDDDGWDDWDEDWD